MNIKDIRPFESAKIDIIELQNLDVITESTGLPFEEEEDGFAEYYWDQN